MLRLCKSHKIRTMVHVIYELCEAAISPLACSSNSLSLFCLALTSALNFEAAALLSLCSSSDANSSFSSAVGSTGCALVNRTKASRICELFECVMSIVSTRSVEAASEGVEVLVVLSRAAGAEVAEPEDCTASGFV